MKDLVIRLEFEQEAFRLQVARYMEVHEKEMAGWVQAALDGMDLPTAIADAIRQKIRGMVHQEAGRMADAHLHTIAQAVEKAMAELQLNEPRQ